MRIVSLLPAATEIIFALGLGDSVVGVSHECDFPPAAARKPALIRPRVDPALPSADLDRQVREIAKRGESLYVIDAGLLFRLQPDLIVTQDLCHVCAASSEDLGAALSRLPKPHQPHVVTFTPHTLAGVAQGIIAIADATGRSQEGQVLAARFAADVAAVEKENAALSSPRVLCLEWFDPLFAPGHWVPEMIRVAGGIDVLGREGEPSLQVSWTDALTTKPDVIVLMSCGYDLQRNIDAWRAISPPSGWSDLPAVKSGHVYAVDANSYFSRSGPRLVHGLKILAGLLHSQRQERHSEAIAGASRV